jgi:hypothetical protein
MSSVVNFFAILATFWNAFEILFFFKITKKHGSKYNVKMLKKN